MKLIDIVELSYSADLVKLGQTMKGFKLIS